jgi:hypothetical protein
MAGKQCTLKLIYWTLTDAADLNESPIVPQRKVLPESKRPSSSQSRVTAWQQFQQLNSMIQPELTEIEFRNLFTKCGFCGLVTTREVNPFHYCPVEVMDRMDDSDISTDLE